jgi:hypothetical protein
VQVLCCATKLDPFTHCPQIHATIDFPRHRETQRERERERESSMLFFGQFCDVAKVAIIHKKDVAKFGYNLNNETKTIYQTSFYIFGYLTLNQASNEIWRFF